MEEEEEEDIGTSIIHISCSIDDSRCIYEDIRTQTFDRLRSKSRKYCWLIALKELKVVLFNRTQRADSTVV